MRWLGVSMCFLRCPVAGGRAVRDVIETPDLRWLLIVAGDVELNPVPLECFRCGLAPRRGQVPLAVVPAVALFVTDSSAAVALAAHVKRRVTGLAVPALAMRRPLQIPRWTLWGCCLLYTSPSPRDLSTSRMPSSA